MENKYWNYLQLVKQQSPLVHNITNFVVMNNTANALLAIGASPVMAHATTEVSEFVTISKSLVINIGTVDEYWAAAMFMAADAANETTTPWVLDPVGAGATSFRDEILQALLERKPTVIRGNASEIIALAKQNTTATKGVDSTDSSDTALESAKHLNSTYGSVVCVSGETDIVVDGEELISLQNGHIMMTKVTGLGCTASALIGAFIGVTENTKDAVVAAMSLIGIAGELAVQQSAGPGSLQLNITDQLYNITAGQFNSRLKISKG
ncbi:MAG: hydroxyethylthiazole kinase [Chitinophagaceae bacterium]|nr:MAG: hydroxyethylthiazole kinase [Chitinophagaceae bacterium]